MQDHGHAATSFSALWSPGIFLLTALFALAYLLFVGPLRERFNDSGPVSTGKKAYFLSGLVVFYIGQGSPLAFYGHHYYFSLHMLQQSLLYLVLPPLIYLGLPGWLLRPLFNKKAFARIAAFFTQPILALVSFNILFSVYHFPVVMNTVMEQGSLQLIYHLVLLFSAFTMWFPVFAPIPEWDHLTDLKKVAYIFANGVLLTPACACIIFANDPLYTMYSNVKVPIEFLPLMDDQQFGGVLMKIIQEIVYGTALAYIFFRWYRSERQKDDPYPEGYVN